MTFIEIKSETLTSFFISPEFELIVESFSYKYSAVLGFLLY